MAGYFEATSRTMQYQVTATPRGAETATPTVVVNVHAVDTDLRAGLDRADLLTPYQYRRQFDASEFTAYNGLLSPMYFGEDVAGALNAFCGIVGGPVANLSTLLQELLTSSEVVVPIFGSPPSEISTLSTLLSQKGTSAAIVVGPAAAGLLTDHTSLPALVVFYVGGTVAVKVVSPVMEAVGQGLAEKVRQAFKLKDPPSR